MPEVVKMKDAKGLDKQWVVLSELASKLVEKNISVPEEAFEKLRIANALISYYLLDPHASNKALSDAEKELMRAQSLLFSVCDAELMNEYLDKMAKALRNELDVKFPLNKSIYNREVKKRGDSESIRIKIKNEIQIERLSDLGEWYGVIFEYSEEEKNKILIEGDINKVKKALKDFSVIWKFESLEEQ